MGSPGMCEHRREQAQGGGSVGIANMKITQRIKHSWPSSEGLVTIGAKEIASPPANIP